jgi:D-arabinose 1-dehydrogenase-like Zn-dependent alcohol dehydrogenase
MAKMRAVQVSRAKGPLEFVQRDIPDPGPGSVRVRVEACGICHSDAVTKEGLLPGIEYPRVPGHEIAGVIDAIGTGVKGWTEGQRVGIGWFGGNCGWCESCRRGDFITCRNMLISGVLIDGGYADYVVVPSSALARMPEELSATDAGPLLCAGITTFNALRRSGAIPPDLVAVLGLGGLGHLGVQFAAKMGFRTVAIARGKDKGDFARKLGAHHYIDTEAQDPAVELTALGGAKVVLATVTVASAMQATLGGLGVNGKLLIVGAPSEPLQVPALPLLFARQSVAGWPSGTAADSQDTLSFAVLQGVRSQNEVYPFERAPEAYDRMMSGKARFRVVLSMT